jgi:hypothetical protein
MAAFIFLQSGHYTRKHKFMAHDLKNRDLETNSNTFIKHPAEEEALTLSNPIFLPPAYSPALMYFGRERGWWVTCNYPTVLKEKNRNRKSTTCAICWLKSILHEEKHRE